MSKNDDTQQQEELIRQLVSKVEALGRDYQDQATRLQMAHVEIAALKAAIEGMLGSASETPQEDTDAISVTVHRDRRHGDRRRGGPPRRSSSRESLCWDRRLGDRRSNGREVGDGVIFI